MRLPHGRRRGTVLLEALPRVLPDQQAVAHLVLVLLGDGQRGVDRSNARSARWRGPPSASVVPFRTASTSPSTRYSVVGAAGVSVTLTRPHR